MKFYPFLLSYFMFCMVSAENQTAEEILLKTLHRMDTIDHSFRVDSNQSGKKNKKERHFQVSVHWPSKGNLIRQTRITSIDSKHKKPSSFWEHRFRDGIKIKRWMSMPITGKLKDVTNKKSRKKEFSFSELDITDEDIKAHNNELFPKEKFDAYTTFVIESSKMGKNGNVKKRKIFWIDVDSYMILKVEFYTGRGRLYRRISCSSFHYVDKILFPMKIDVEDLKSKTDMKITVQDIVLNPKFDMDIFIPQDQ